MDAIPPWTREDDKRFELALVQFPEDSPYFLDNIANILQKPVNEVKYYYEALVHDLDLIESGQVALPNYRDDDYVPLTEASQFKFEKQRQKRKPWTPEEHRLFLGGLNKYGQRDWKSISTECVKTRTPKQVADHAYQYSKWQNLKSKEGKRSSIFDMTLGDADNVIVPGSNLESMSNQPEFSDQNRPNDESSQGSSRGV